MNLLFFFFRIAIAQKVLSRPPFIMIAAWEISNTKIGGCQCPNSIPSLKNSEPKLGSKGKPTQWVISVKAVPPLAEHFFDSGNGPKNM